jgi:hypothetical protein
MKWLASLLALINPLIKFLTHYFDPAHIEEKKKKERDRELDRISREILQLKRTRDDIIKKQMATEDILTRDALGIQLGVITDELDRLLAEESRIASGK